MFFRFRVNSKVRIPMGSRMNKKKREKTSSSLEMFFHASFYSQSGALWEQRS